MSSMNLYYKEARYDLLSIMRTPGFVLPALAFPLMFYLFFGVFFRAGAGADYLLVTYSCFGIMGPAMFNFAAGIASDRAHGWLTLKQLSPMPFSAYLLAKLSTSLVFSVCILILLFSAATMFGDVRLHSTQWQLLAVVMLAGSVPFALLGLLLGLSLSDKAAPGVVNLIYLPMAFLSGLWLPLFLFPGWLQQLAWLWPSFHLSQLGLKVIAQDQGNSVLAHLGVLALLTAVLATICARLFRRR
ncbi:ABC transporter permease [Rheinheimera aquimaris]|uniref:ABC transporter permease n=1 Tax=Rheinheimera aquimaris TaxID=412437 RepID=UPI003A97840C